LVNEKRRGTDNVAINPAGKKKVEGFQKGTDFCITPAGLKIFLGKESRLTRK